MSGRGLEGGGNIWPLGESMLAQMFGPRPIKCSAVVMHP